MASKLKKQQKNGFYFLYALRLIDRTNREESFSITLLFAKEILPLKENTIRNTHVVI